MFIQIPKFIKKKRFKDKMRYGKNAEKEAMGFLVRKGYEILSYQDRVKYKIKINDEIKDVNIIADFLVRKNGRIYIVEVKTGDVATSLKSSATRRQLLEYSEAYYPYRLLLLDMERGILSSIDFLFNKRKNTQMISLYFILGFFVGGVFIYFITKIK